MGQMTKELLQSRRYLVEVYFRCLKVKHPDDPEAMKRDVMETIGVTVGTFRRWQVQSTSKTHVASGIPIGDNAIRMRDHVTVLIDLFDLFPSGLPRKHLAVSPNLPKDFPRPPSHSAPVQQEAWPLVSKPAPAPAPVAAMRSPEEVGDLQIIRALMGKLDRASLRVVIDHAVELSIKK